MGVASNSALTAVRVCVCVCVCVCGLSGLFRRPDETTKTITPLIDNRDNGQGSAVADRPRDALVLFRNTVMSLCAQNKNATENSPNFPIVYKHTFFLF